MSYTRPTPSLTLQQAQQLHRRGDLNGAEKAYKKAIEENASDATAWQMLGVLYYQRKSVQKAFECFERSLNIDPENLPAWINFGVMLEFERRPEDALVAFEEVLKRNPTHAEALHMKGFVLNGLGKYAEAASALRLATQIEPLHTSAWFQLGNALSELRSLNEAETAFKKATELDPQNHEAWNNLGNTYLHLGKGQEALGALRRAHQLQPAHTEIMVNLGYALYTCGLLSEAGPLLEQATKRAPKNVKAWRTLGQAQMQFKRPEKAIECYNKAVSLNPADASTVRLRSIAYAEQGMVDEARTSIDEITEKLGELPPSLQVLKEVTLPVIVRNRGEIDEVRARVLRETQRLAQSGLQIQNPLAEVGGTSFYLAYHRDNEIELQKSIAQMYLALCPNLAWTAPHCLNGKKPGDRIRLGVCSAFLNEHTIGKLFSMMIQLLDKEKFEVIVFHTAYKQDAITKRLQENTDKTVWLSNDLFDARQQVAEAELDALFYTDIGMDPQTYYMAFSRLAPVQFMTWGHPVTTGIPNIDYFLSSTELETPTSDKEYTEKLVRLPDLNTYFLRPSVPERIKDRAGFGLPEEKKLYCCPQTLFKLHPDFDDGVAELLRKDRNGLLVLIEGKYPSLAKRLKARFEQSHPDVADRMVFLPMMPTEDYLSLNIISDAVIDPFYFGGGNSSLEIFAMGRPIVTLPGELLRARITRAEYIQMGYTDLIVDSPEAFVESSYKLANDLDWRRHCREHIHEKAGVLYENRRVVEQLSNWIESVVTR